MYFNKRINIMTALAGCLACDAQDPNIKTRRDSMLIMTSSILEECSFRVLVVGA